MMHRLILVFVLCLVNHAFGIKESTVDAIRTQTVAPFVWILDLLTNSVSYLMIMLPLLILRTYMVRSKEIGHSTVSNLVGFTGFVQMCFVPDVSESTIHGSLPLPVLSQSSDYSGIRKCVGTIQSCLGLNVKPAARTTKQYHILLAVCALGLQISYVLWGIIQERIMTRDYDGDMFGTSQFLVFSNRLFTLLIVLFIQCLPLDIVTNPLRAGHRAPFFEFSFASISNIVSSWCQYEALKFISFPTQVLSKACKVIPVMIMGKFVQHRSYTVAEYITASLICIGLSMFLLSDPINEQSLKGDITDRLSSASGAILILGYIILDSFTSNWQDRMFKDYSLSVFQVMVGVNFWSLVLTLLPLIQRGSLSESIRFAMLHPDFGVDVLLSATCSATGQVFIFLTIANFGPATFALIATLRMGLSIFISCIIFSHPLSRIGTMGLVLVFIALLLRIRLRASQTLVAKTDVIPLSTDTKVAMVISG